MGTSSGTAVPLQVTFGWDIGVPSVIVADMSEQVSVYAKLELLLGFELDDDNLAELELLLGFELDDEYSSVLELELCATDDEET